jgi:hypothetical protein
MVSFAVCRAAAYAIVLLLLFSGHHFMFLRLVRLFMKTE